MQEPCVVAAAEMPRVLETLTLAFAADPVERWLYPELRQYRASFPRFLEAFAGDAFAEETVWQLADFAAVAVWLPPGTQADGESIVSVLTETVHERQHEDTLAVLEQMDEAHPGFPHWYLPWLGVDPARQGSGLGGELLTHGLRTVDRDHLPAYLETPNPRTVPFYRRHGFQVTGQARGGQCPPVTFMLRHAR
jgi:ribosomal protein S18 acetylase RimI-like enzyme